jgi:hypothetical protein
MVRSAHPARENFTDTTMFAHIFHFAAVVVVVVVVTVVMVAAGASLWRLVRGSRGKNG